jgi:hypothetical protein
MVNLNLSLKVFIKLISPLQNIKIPLFLISKLYDSSNYFYIKYSITYLKFN